MVERKILPRLSRKMLESSFFLECVSSLLLLLSWSVLDFGSAVCVGVADDDMVEKKLLQWLDDGTTFVGVYRGDKLQMETASN